MKTLHIIILTIFCGLALLFSTQHGYSIPYQTPADLYKQSDMVFYGQVISKQTGPGPDYYYYQVKVETYFKNPQTSDSITVAGHKPDPKIGYPQFEVGDKAIFYTGKEQGMNVLSPYSTKAGDGCDIHAFLGPAPIQGEPIARNPGVPLALLDENGSMVGSSLTNHPVFLTYDIGNNYPFSKNFTIEAFVEDQNYTSITFYKKQVLELGACESTGDALKWSFAPTKSGTYSLNVNIDGQFRLGYGFRVTDVNPASNQNSQVVSSPLKQFKSGISANDVKCKEDLQLVIKGNDGSPACVKPDTAIKLELRGWAAIPTTANEYKVPESFMPCNTPYPQSNTGVAVLYMPVNSIGKICVRYSNPNDTPEPIFGIMIFDPNNSNRNATGITTWSDLGNNYTISKGDSTVVYWINTGNQTGFYGLVLSCGGSPFGGTPFAVGYDNNSKIVSSDFPFLGVDHSCPIMLYDSHIDSLTGIGVKHIP